MKIAQFMENGRIRLGLIEGESLQPMKFEGAMIDFISGDRRLVTENQSVPMTEVNFAPSVTGMNKIIAIGLNYEDHAEESKGEVPDIPLIFAKFPNSLIGHGHTIIWKEDITKKVDYEAELAVVIGKTACDISEEEAPEAVFGYTCANDVSARDLQFGDGQWVRGKSLDTFCPLGPWIVTADELTDPHDLGIRSILNGKRMQDSHTGRMFFRIPQIVHFLSKHMTLFPGDVILTGTPAGVGVFRKPSLYLKDGDEIAIEIDGIGRLVNPCRVLKGQD